MEQILSGRIPLSIRSLLETTGTLIFDSFSNEATIEDYLITVKLFHKYGISYDVNSLLDKMFYDDHAPFYLWNEEIEEIDDKELAKFVSYLFEVSENKTALSQDLYMLFEFCNENEKLKKTFTVLFFNMEVKDITGFIFYHNIEKDYWNLNELLSLTSPDRLNEILYEYVSMALERIKDDPGYEIDFTKIDTFLANRADPFYPVKDDKSTMNIIEKYRDTDDRINELENYFLENRLVGPKPVDF